MWSNEYIIVNKRETAEVIESYLKNNVDVFTPPLNSRVDIHLFSVKIFQNAEQFWVLMDEKVIGFMACYFNHPKQEYGFISTISLKSEFQGKGIGKKLINKAISYARKNQFKQIQLEVNRNNTKARVFYERLGFTASGSSSQSDFLKLII
ncbi:GNAT family N-acetyltransferase [Maribellus sediminis]|uniref:GNAT family N-acetyltransferase n=1 Tax=Maribellus sediminis TaxID=2696285 RepID=UPI0014304BE4|nr:GNAT family N-acetyltransferase [Maribellus sediminis]